MPRYPKKPPPQGYVVVCIDGLHFGYAMMFETRYWPHEPGRVPGDLMQVTDGHKHNWQAVNALWTVHQQHVQTANAWKEGNQ